MSRSRAGFTDGGALARDGGQADHASSPTPGPHSADEYGEPPLGRAAHPRRVGEARHHRLRTDCVALSAQPDEGPSQTWRTFLANHFGDLTCEAATASSELPSDDAVVGTGWSSFELTPASAI